MRPWARAAILLHGEGQFIAPWDTLQDNVLVLDSRLLQRLLRSREQGVDDFGVPARVYNADPQPRS